jgi:preprotein translocase subunit YajC
VGLELLIPLLAVLLLFVMFNGQRKRQRQQALMQAQVVPGTRICTTSGLFGTVVEVSDGEIVIEAAPGVNLRYDRRAIGLVVPSGEAPDGVGTTDLHHEEPADPGRSGETDGHDKPA